MLHLAFYERIENRFTMSSLCPVIQYVLENKNMWLAQLVHEYSGEHQGTKFAQSEKRLGYKNSNCPMWGNLKQSWMWTSDPSDWIQDSTSVNSRFQTVSFSRFRIIRPRFRIYKPRFRIFRPRFLIPWANVSWLPESGLSLTGDSKHAHFYRRTLTTVRWSARALQLLQVRTQNHESQTLGTLDTKRWR